MPKAPEIKQLLADLTGQAAPLEADVPLHVDDLLKPGGQGLGLSQLNELLLSFGYDRVRPEFFQYLADGTTDFSHDTTIDSYSSLQKGIDSFRELALLKYGNIKFGFKRLSRDEIELEMLLDSLQPIDDEIFTSRHAEVHRPDPIPGEETYYLGYVIRDEIKKRLQKDPSDTEAKREMRRRESVLKQAQDNHKCCLVSDHLDVYIATSMRERHEYLMVNEFVKDIFDQKPSKDDKKALKDLNLRYFDPTQADCGERIDKGLSEALMLKRARCTIYFAQESDTLGKDSELASTLAQGKPVIAFVPREEEYSAKFMKSLRKAYPTEDEVSLLLRQLQFFDPGAAWKEKQVREWINAPDKADAQKVEARFFRAMRELYNKRANLLREIHPLGLQVHLETGVANGVLVVRNVKDCAKIVYRVITNTLAFNVTAKTIDGRPYVFLKEEVSGCIFRVMSGDDLLTNSFWNFYFES